MSNQEDLIRALININLKIEKKCKLSDKINFNLEKDYEIKFKGSELSCIIQLTRGFIEANKHKFSRKNLEKIQAECDLK